MSFLMNIVPGPDTRLLLCLKFTLVLFTLPGGFVPPLLFFFLTLLEEIVFLSGQLSRGAHHAGRVLQECIQHVALIDAVYIRVCDVSGPVGTFMNLFSVCTESQSD
jgi:hypothetical protein